MGWEFSKFLGALDHLRWACIVMKKDEYPYFVEKATFSKITNCPIQRHRDDK